MTRILVRERAPLRLHATVVAPDGYHARWGEDEPLPDNTLEQESFSTVLPGGFEQGSCSLQRLVDRDYPDLELMETVQFRGAGGELAAEFRLEGSPRDWGEGESAVSPQLAGWQNHLQDTADASMIYIDRDLTRWTDPTVRQQLVLAAADQQLNSTQATADPVTDLPALVQSITDSWVSPNLPVCEGWYDAGPGNLIASIYYSVISPGAALASIDELFISSDDVGTTSEGTGNVHTTSGASAYLSPSTAYRFALAYKQAPSTPGGAQGAQFYTSWSNLAVYGDHGLTLYGTDPKGVLASDVTADLLSRFAPKIGFTTGPNGSIQPSSFVIPHLAFPTLGWPSDMLTQTVRFELLDWAVWEGPTMWLNQRGAYARARNWKGYLGPSKLQDTGPQISRLWNQVVVQYTDVTGTTRTAGPPGSGADTEDSSLQDTDPQNPANQAGFNRCAPLTMGTSTAAGAVQIGAVFLQEQKLLDTSGQAALTGWVEDDRGVFWPAWKVRAGDTFTPVDASDPSPRRIVHTSYDGPSKTNTIQLDSPPQGLQQLLERMSVVLSPLGFS